MLPYNAINVSNILCFLYDLKDISCYLTMPLACQEFCICVPLYVTLIHGLTLNHKNNMFVHMKTCWGQVWGCWFKHLVANCLPQVLIFVNCSWCLSLKPMLSFPLHLAVRGGWLLKYVIHFCSYNIERRNMLIYQNS